MAHTADGGASGQQDFVGGRLNRRRAAAQLGSILDRDIALVARAVGRDLGGCDFIGCRGQARLTRCGAPNRSSPRSAATAPDPPFKVEHLRCEIHMQIAIENSSMPRRHTIEGQND